MQDLGHYTNVELLAEHGMASVFVAEDRRDGKRVAIKTVRGRNHTYLDREFEILRGLSHPNIITVHERFVIAGATYFSMELVDAARPLNDALGALREESAFRVLRQLVVAVDHIHAQGLVHYELSPANLLVDRAGRLVVIDFEHCRKLHEDESDIWPAGVIAGTPLYMSPEHLGKPACVEADYFVVGTLLLEWVLGRHPFPVSDLQGMEGWRRCVEGANGALARELLRDSPSPLAAVIQRLWDTSPAIRREGWVTLRERTLRLP
ncbi:MAG TPA: serine/threonine-protein kinase [Planctomycetota bacterium]